MPWGARWGAIVGRRRATRRLLKRSITGIYQSSSYSVRRQPTGEVSFASRELAAGVHLDGLQAEGGGPEGVQGLNVAAAVFLLQELVNEVDR
jgi:hypothetical protein